MALSLFVLNHKEITIQMNFGTNRSLIYA